MLASAGTPADLADKDWQFELKWDGVRALVLGDSQRIRLISRNGNDMSASYPEAHRPRLLAPAGLRRRRRDHRRRPVGKARLRAAAGADETQQGRRRREGAGRHPGAPDAFRPAHRGRRGPPAPPAAGAAETPRSVRRGRLPGRQPGRFLPGGTLRGDRRRRRAPPGERAGARARGGDGQAHRRTLRGAAEPVLAQAEVREDPGGGGRRLAARQRRPPRLGRLAAAGHPGREDTALRGRVGSGFSTRELQELRRQLDAIPARPPLQRGPRGGRRRRPVGLARLVGEVTFGDWTSSGKLRHPVWRGWRLDKAPADVVAEHG